MRTGWIYHGKENFKVFVDWWILELHVPITVFFQANFKLSILKFSENSKPHKLRKELMFMQTRFWWWKTKWRKEECWPAVKIFPAPVNTTALQSVSSLICRKHSTISLCTIRISDKVYFNRLFSKFINPYMPIFNALQTKICSSKSTKQCLTSKMSCSLHFSFLAC